VHVNLASHLATKSAPRGQISTTSRIPAGGARYRIRWNPILNAVSVFTVSHALTSYCWSADDDDDDDDNGNTLTIIIVEHREWKRVLFIHSAVLILYTTLTLDSLLMPSAFLCCHLVNNSEAVLFSRITNREEEKNWDQDSDRSSKSCSPKKMKIYPQLGVLWVTCRQADRQTDRQTDRLTNQDKYITCSLADQWRFWGLHFGGPLGWP